MKTREAPHTANTYEENNIIVEEDALCKSEEERIRMLRLFEILIEIDKKLNITRNEYSPVDGNTDSSC